MMKVYAPGLILAFTLVGYESHALGRKIMRTTQRSGILVLICAAVLGSAVTAQAEEKKVADLWTELASADAAKAYQAILTLTATPQEAVPLLKKMLRPIPAPDADKIAQLLKDLQSDKFAVRDKAMQALEKLGEVVEPDLRKASAVGTVEARRRIEKLLERLQGPVTQPEVLQGLRAIEVLENIGTREAREVLQGLAKGAPGARLTQEARASVDRLEKRPAPAP
jgi:hypothetical protein